MRHERQAALDKLLPMQRRDYKDMLEIVAPYPVTVRLLDPPMHEFLPGEQQLPDETEIYEMQIRGILEATAGCMKEGKAVFPEIMVTLCKIAWGTHLRNRLALSGKPPSASSAP